MRFRFRALPALALVFAVALPCAAGTGIADALAVALERTRDRGAHGADAPLAVATRAPSGRRSRCAMPSCSQPELPSEPAVALPIAAPAAAAPPVTGRAAVRA